jgi:hypothetical protein
MPETMELATTAQAMVTSGITTTATAIGGNIESLRNATSEKPTEGGGVFDLLSLPLLSSADGDVFDLQTLRLLKAPRAEQDWPHSLTVRCGSGATPVNALLSDSSLLSCCMQSFWLLFS